jgi:hypothetical protein
MFSEEESHVGQEWIEERVVRHVFVCQRSERHRGVLE